MAQARLFLDTNVIVDFLGMREPFYRSARMLMIGGRAGEFDLWMSSSQVTDLIYILSEGGRAALMPRVLERLRGLRTFVRVAELGAPEIDRMLSTSWKDPEDALLYECALRTKADFIITRNGADFEGRLVQALDCDGLFDWMREERGIDYALMES